MWTNRFTPKGELRPPPPGVGRMIITGGAGVLAILGGTYLSMIYSKRRQERSGTNPIYEQVLAHVGTKPISSSPNGDDPSLPTRSSQLRSNRTMKPPVQEHDAQHDSIQYRKTRSNSGDLDQPTPQREKNDGSGTLVSQSKSDYMKGPKRDR